MKYIITHSKEFKKDFKKLNKDEKSLLKEILEAKYKDHALSGNLKGFRECHILPDLLLIYEKIENELTLNALRVGKHIKLF